MGTIGRKKLLARKQNPRGPSLGTLLSTLSKRLKKKTTKMSQRSVQKEHSDKIKEYVRREDQETR